MAANRRPAWLPFVIPAALLTGLLAAAGGESRAQNKAAKAGAKVQEAAVLKDAYVLMAMGNHDYEGRRVKAMHEVEGAIKKLDHTVMKDGANGQKVVAAESEIATAREAFLARHKDKVHEAQAVSDLQMREALDLLKKVHGSLSANKHAKVREHVGEAIKHVETALKIR